VSVNPWGDRIARALSVRVIVVCLLGGVCIGVLAGMAWPNATMPVVWLSALGLYLIAIFNDGQMVKCDACRKRVKLGAERCPLRVRGVISTVISTMT
jgi:hypothetical protein